jgi:hypothetical protein
MFEYCETKLYLSFYKSPGEMETREVTKILFAYMFVQQAQNRFKGPHITQSVTQWFTFFLKYHIEFIKIRRGHNKWQYHYQFLIR